MHDKEVLFVHQSADLYGSDRVLVSLVLHLRSLAFHPVVLLPVTGPLYQLLVTRGVETHVLPLVKISRNDLSLSGILSLPLKLISSLWQIRKLVRNRNISLVYSNTLAVLSGAIYAKYYGIPHIWHVHELLVQPKIAAKLFPWFMRLFSDTVVCNSSQTRAWVVGQQSAIGTKTTMIHNGVSRIASGDPVAISGFRQQVGACSSEQVVVTLVGRINRMKGQGVFVDAAEILWTRGYRSLRFVMVGSAPTTQEHFLSELVARLDRSPAKETISILDFRENVWPVWDGSDIAIVPSIEPESFGLVAIEAMAAGLPVVASAHGGLLDIIEPGHSGVFVKPGCAISLADAIAQLADDRILRATIGEKGRLRQATLFLLSRQLDQLVHCVEKTIASRRA